MSDIAELKAGHELDLLIAEKVFGWQRGRRYGNGNGEWVFPLGTEPYFRNDWDGTPRYSTDIKAAWQVVEHLRAAGWEMALSCNSFKTDMWDCRLLHISLDYPYLTTAKAIAFGPDAPTAICRAALSANTTK